MGTYRAMERPEVLVDGSTIGRSSVSTLMGSLIMQSLCGLVSVNIDENYTAL